MWIRLDECDALPVLHRRDCKSDGQRAFAASAFLGDQSKDIHLLRVPDDNDMKHTSCRKNWAYQSVGLPLPIVNCIKSERGTHNQIKAQPLTIYRAIRRPTPAGPYI